MVVLHLLWYLLCISGYDFLKRFCSLCHAIVFLNIMLMQKRQPRAQNVMATYQVSYCQVCITLHIMFVVLHRYRSSRRHCTYRQGWAVWRLCSCCFIMEQHVMLQPRTSTHHFMLLSRRVMKMLLRYFSTVELNTTLSHGYHVAACLAMHAALLIR